MHPIPSPSSDLRAASQRVISNTLTASPSPPPSPYTTPLTSAHPAAVGALIGSAIGVQRNIPAIPSAFKTGLNVSIFSFSFFSIREYLITPLLPPPSPAASPRTSSLLSTSLSALLTGTLFSFYTRTGTHSFLPHLRLATRGGLTLALAATALQAAVNEVGLLRIELVAWGEERDRLWEEQFAHQSVGGEKEAPPTFTRDISSATPSVPSRETFSERSDRLVGDAWEGAKRRLERWSPVKKMEEGEYERLLRSRLAELDREREEVRREREALESGMRGR